MGYPSFITGEILTAADMNRVGLWRITSKTFTSTASAQQIDDCFTTNFVNYRIVIRATGNQGTPTNLSARLVDGTTPDTVANYYYNQSYVTPGGAALGYWSAAQNSWNVGWLGDITGLVTLDITAPQLAVNTSFHSLSAAFGNVNSTNGTTFATKLTTTQYEGIWFQPGAGTWAGRIDVYGYNNG